MANFALSSIRPHLMQQSVEYERNKFQEFLNKQPSKEVSPDKQLKLCTYQSSRHSSLLFRLKKFR